MTGRFLFKPVALGFCAIFCLMVLLGCSDGKNIGSESTPTQPPQWAKQAIWYQIMVERFHNGDPTNDPTKQSIVGSYPGFIPSNWATTPWTQAWYHPDDYFAQMQGAPDFSGSIVTSFDAKTALRRYGGDIQGVIDKLDYLEDLGINAIYFNPINDAPSLHKYDARHWRHVDVNFGPDPQGDRLLIAQEDPADPDTWVFTSADKLFLHFLEQAKARGIRVILDYSWNHTGHTFWAWQDVLKNQKHSEYADWYWVKQFDDPDTVTDEFDYRGWFGVYELPEIQETHYVDHSEKLSLSEGNIKSEHAKQHILAVTQRWLDPNADGDPSDGIDGYRLDVAAEMPLGFWREYRTFVKSINPEAYLIGEIWWEQWPDDLFDPMPVLQGDIFDAVMNYRWYRSARHFFASAPNNLSSAEFVQQLKALKSNLADDFNYAMMNMSASHDSPRLLTSLNNKNKYKYQAKESQNSAYKFQKPAQSSVQLAKLLLLHQFTYIGAPQIWMGDEMGMWGSDDPNNRKPLIWPEFSFEDESQHPFGQKLSEKIQRHPVKFNKELHQYYRFLANLRRNNDVLSLGKIEFLSLENNSDLLAYRRYDDQGNQIFVIFNNTKQQQQVNIPSQIVSQGNWQTFTSNGDLVLSPSVPSEQLFLPEKSAIVIVVSNVKRTG